MGDADLDDATLCRILGQCPIPCRVLLRADEWQTVAAAKCAGLVALDVDGDRWTLTEAGARALLALREKGWT